MISVSSCWTSQPLSLRRYNLQRDQGGSKHGSQEWPMLYVQSLHILTTSVSTTHTVKRHENRKNLKTIKFLFLSMAYIAWSMTVVHINNKNKMILSNVLTHSTFYLPQTTRNPYNPWTIFWRHVSSCQTSRVISMTHQLMIMPRSSLTMRLSCAISGTAWGVLHPSHHEQLRMARGMYISFFEDKIGDV